MWDTLFVLRLLYMLRYTMFTATYSSEKIRKALGTLVKYLPPQIHLVPQLSNAPELDTKHGRQQICKQAAHIINILMHPYPEKVPKAEVL